MMKQAQVVAMVGFRNRRLASGGCNLMWDDAHMTEEEKAKEQAALERLDTLTTAFDATKEAHEKAREELRVAIVEILMTRQAAPGKVAAHSPYGTTFGASLMLPASRRCASEPFVAPSVLGEQVTAWGAPVRPTAPGISMPSSQGPSPLASHEPVTQVGRQL